MQGDQKISWIGTGDSEKKLRAKVGDFGPNGIRTAGRIA
jgi:hypothetical protein